MAYHGRSRGRDAAVAFALVAAGCGSKPEGTATTIAVEDTASSDAVESDDAGSSGGGPAGITAIDAASGSGAALPADSYSPSAYDLARARGNRAGRPQSSPVEADGDAAAGGDLGLSGDVADPPRSGADAATQAPDPSASEAPPRP